MTDALAPVTDAPASGPPEAPRRPQVRRVHGEEVTDDYAWLRDAEDPAVLAHLEAENAWTTTALAHTAELQSTLFEEIRARVQETDLSVPVRKGPWWYYGRTVEGQQYGIHCRRPVTDPDELEPADGAVEQVLLDENALAQGHDYFALGAFEVSPDHAVLAYAVDTSGAERYDLRFRDLDHGTDLDDEILATSYGSAWAADSRTYFYVRPDQAVRPFQLWRHILGTDATDDVLVKEELDARFFLGVGTTKDERFVLCHVGSKITDEWWFLPTDQPTAELRVIEPRQQGLEYSVEHKGDRFLIVTNADGADDFKLVSAPDDEPGRDRWTTVVDARPGVTLSRIDVFADWLVLFERADAVRRIRVLGDDGSDHVLDQPEAVSTTSGGANPEFDSHVLRYGYTSLVTPASTYDYDLRTRQRTLRKQQPVLGGYDPAAYVTERLWATAPDGTEVPMSLVHRAEVMADGSAPALLYGYGSYEISIDPAFSSARLSLLERGFVFAIAHVRGGGELGRRWYDDGKLLRKRNTFSDFVACAEALVAAGWTTPERLAIRGGSAGGLLMGAVTNLAPDRFAAVVAEVPFVDCVNTILDPSLPLTVTEWEEWGNPVDDPEVYAYMRSYGPYENVAPVDHPAILATAGLNDPRVSYWEPAKWVAKLRATGTGSRPVLLKTEMGAGHGGPSGRYDAWRDEAMVYAFVLDALAVR